MFRFRVRFLFGSLSFFILQKKTHPNEHAPPQHFCSSLRAREPDRPEGRVCLPRGSRVPCLRQRRQKPDAVAPSLLLDCGGKVQGQELARDPRQRGAGLCLGLAHVEEAVHELEQVGGPAGG